MFRTHAWPSFRASCFSRAVHRIDRENARKSERRARDRMHATVSSRRPDLQRGCSHKCTPFRWTTRNDAPVALPLPPPACCTVQLCDICLAWLGDNVFSIRVAATDNLKRLTDHFGTPWARDHILPKVSRPSFFFLPCAFRRRWWLIYPVLRTRYVAWCPAWPGLEYFWWGLRYIIFPQINTSNEQVTGSRACGEIPCVKGTCRGFESCFSGLCSFSPILASLLPLPVPTAILCFRDQQLEPISERQVVQMHIHSSYLHRMTALYAIKVLTESLDVDMLSKVRTARVPKRLVC